MNHYVYLIEIDGFYKIGITTNLETRLRHYNTHSPHPYRVVKTYLTNSLDDSLQIEQNSIKKLQNFQIYHSKEWFVRNSLNSILSVVDTEYQKLIDTKKVIDFKSMYANTSVQELENMIDYLKNFNSIVIANHTGISTMIINKVKKKTYIPCEKYFNLLMMFIKEMKNAN